MEDGDLSELDREPHEDFYFRVRIVKDRIERMPERKSVTMERFKVTEKDLAWLETLGTLPTYYGGASWVEVGAAWDNIKESYDAHIK